jgi:hypothetical protein
MVRGAGYFGIFCEPFLSGRCLQSPPGNIADIPACFSGVVKSPVSGRNEKTEDPSLVIRIPVFRSPPSSSLVLPTDGFENVAFAFRERAPLKREQSQIERHRDDS